jgi:hypothetical protein
MTGQGRGVGGGRPTIIKCCAIKNAEKNTMCNNKAFAHLKGTCSEDHMHQVVTYAGDGAADAYVELMRSAEKNTFLKAGLAPKREEIGAIIKTAMQAEASRLLSAADAKVQPVLKEKVEELKAGLDQGKQGKREREELLDERAKASKAAKRELNIAPAIFNASLSMSQDLYSIHTIEPNPVEWRENPLAQVRCIFNGCNCVLCKHGAAVVSMTLHASMY